MNPDAFEQRLARQPLRAVPEDWRAEILGAVGPAEPGRLPVVREVRAGAGSWWRDWLWPAPTAWAGLAAIWLVVAGLNFAATERGPRPVIPPAALASYWAAQQQFMAELLRVPPVDPADVPRGSTRPRPKPPGSSSLKTHDYETVA